MILSFSVAAAAAVASNATFESVGFDFEASDAIFADDEPSTANAGDNDNDDGEENADEDNDCDCSTCRERMRHKEELNRYICITYYVKRFINIVSLDLKFLVCTKVHAVCVQKFFLKFVF